MKKTLILSLAAILAGSACLIGCRSAATQFVLPQISPEAINVITRQEIAEAMIAHRGGKKFVYIAYHNIDTENNNVVDVQVGVRKIEDIQSDTMLMNADNWHVNRRYDPLEQSYTDDVIIFDGDKVIKTETQTWKYSGTRGSVFVGAEDFGMKRSTNQWKMSDDSGKQQ